MRSEPNNMQGINENAAQEFVRDRQDEFLLDELRGTLEDTRNNCDHNKETIGQWMHEDANQSCFLVERCEVCGEKLIVPDHNEGSKRN